MVSSNKNKKMTSSLKNINSSSSFFDLVENENTKPIKEKVLSIDVGIKNLSFCLFSRPYIPLNTNSNDYVIEKWEVIDLTEKEVLLCKETDKLNNICNKEAKYTKNGKCFCLKHSKKSSYMFPNQELKKSKLNGYNISQLKDIITKYQINIGSSSSSSEQPSKKKDILSSIYTFLEETCLNTIENKNCSQFNMITYGKNINNIFNKIFTNEDIMSISHICIENQMTSKMRILSYMLAQYFIVKKSSIIIEMVSPCHKLKEFEIEKTNYSTRKKNSVKYCLEIIMKNPNFINWKDFFTSHKKKDDLSDAFLQGRWFISTIIK